ncbi:phosphotransferase enzyme family protein [Paenibacillus sp. R14(2021)]|uniref:phosphotransferase enzyme family protein n=1 Tax=Paenibacillus sp. R14(2021) TaxID=2859228 RepID=UPI001C6114F2|nr:phosphotransferase [Paenibacillus sp. R14(2021)]
MLKLKHLFNNEPLAEMLLGNWAYDKESIELFQYYRISSNAIYPFRFEGATRLLRFAPKAEKSEANILAELDFIAYLRAQGYGVLEAVASNHGEELVEARTPWGDYYASVFKRVAGVQINQTDFSDAIVFSHGKALGRLHYLSSTYTPAAHKRWSQRDVLAWMQDVLDDFPHETAARMESERLQAYFAALPTSSDYYGLIHYDFEYDNVFYDEAAGSCNVIDFDDAMYHWYVMDIEQALDSLKDGIPSDRYDQKKQCFMDGYLTEFSIAPGAMAFLPACRRFANLYGYVRCLRSMSDQWVNEPEWMTNLRANLMKSMGEASRNFGQDIPAAKR